MEGICSFSHGAYKAIFLWKPEWASHESPNQHLSFEQLNMKELVQTHATPKAQDKKELLFSWMKKRNHWCETFMKDHSSVKPYNYCTNFIIQGQGCSLLWIWLSTHNLLKPYFLNLAPILEIHILHPCFCLLMFLLKLRLKNTYVHHKQI